MAEIKIEKKKQIWPWILLGLAIAALLVYFLVFHDNNNSTVAAIETDYISDTNNTSNTSESPQAGARGKNASVSAYVNFVENTRGEMGLDHDYSNEALLKLIEATNAMANEVGYEVRADIGRAREYANNITEDPYETTHADYIRNAADILTNVLHNIQRSNYTGLANEAEELRRASESIKPGTQTLEQKKAVKTYFATASDLLKKMNS